MLSKIKKAFRYPSKIPFKIDRKLGSIRGKYEFESNSNISLLANILRPETVDIGEQTHLQPFCVLKPKQDGIKIGDYCTIHEFAFMAGDITIGDNVRIAQKVSMHSFNHGTAREQLIREQPLNHGKITIEDDVWIGCDVTILKDVSIGKGAVVGAGSIVTADVEPYAIVAGNPAEQIDSRK